MKKYLSLFLVALMLFAFLVSCSSSQNENGVNSSGNNSIQDSTNQSDTSNEITNTENSNLPDAPPTDNSTENTTFTKNEKGNLVNTKGVEYEFLAGEAFLYYLGELEFVGSVEGEEEYSWHLDMTYQTGMFAIKEAENDNILIRKSPDSEWFSIYRKASLPKMDYSMENCVRLEFISETYNTSVSHTTCADGITDKSEILSFIEDIRAQKSPQEAGLYDLVRQPNGGLENCYAYGAIYAFFEEEPNLAVMMIIKSYNDLAYSISVDNKDYVLPAEWFMAFQNK